MRIHKLALTWLATLGLAQPAAATPQNIILMIGDGMGNPHVEAARAYNGGPLAFESAPHQTQMTTYALDNEGNPIITDSAASATAIATGHKVVETVVSTAIPGDLSELPTSLEFWSAQGKRTGLVTTSFITDATSAAFGAHAVSRVLTADITNDYLTQTRPNLLLGTTRPFGGMTPAAASGAGYTVVETRAELFSLELDAHTHISGQFAGINGGLLDTITGFEWDYAQGAIDTYDTAPFLSEMTSVALPFLDMDPDGFFLVIEQEGTDTAGHLPVDDPQKIQRDVFATLEFNQSVAAVLDWIALRDDPSDTLLIVTADHETGGLEVLADNGPGMFPTVSWASDEHSDQTVPVYAWGPGADQVTGLIDNTDIYRITVPEPSAAGLLVSLTLGLAYARRRLIQT